MSETIHPPSPAKIPLINGLRGVAILGVVLHHLFGQVIVQGENLAQLGPIPISPFTLITNSYQGVALFFLLSGFVLTLPYVQRRRTMSSLSDVWEFLKRRAARLLPLYYLAVLIGLIFIAPTQDFTLFAKKFLLFATGTFTFTSTQFFPAENFVLWSLSLEILFCLCFPLILFCMQRYGVWRIVISLCLFALAARFFGIFMIVNRIAELFTGTTTPAFNSIFCRIDDFVLGMALAFVYVRKPHIRPWLLYFTGFLLVLAGFSLRDFSGVVLSLTIQPLTNSLVNLGFFTVLTAMLLRPHWVWRLTIENRALQLIGLMSYSIFVWHGVAMAPLDANVDVLHLVRYAVVVFALSFLTYRHIETSIPKKLSDILPAKKRSHERSFDVAQ